MVKTNIRQNSGSLPWCFRAIAPLEFIWPSAEKFALTPFQLATAPETRALNGTFVGSRVGKKVRIPAQTQDTALRQRLWRASEALVTEHLS